MPERALLDQAQVAARLGRRPSWFRKHRAALEAAGFPPRLPVINRWDGAAIDAWLDRQMPPALRPANDDGADLIAAEERELLRRLAP